MLRQHPAAKASLLPIALLCAASAFAQQTPVSPPIVQPGAPGKPNKTLSPNTAAAPLRAPSPADVKFMQDMIMHHNQAVEMTALLKTRSKDPEVQEIGRRISVSQADEMRFMTRWLQERGQPLSAPMDDMGGMDMSAMPVDPDKAMMPGMLTPRQMQTLAKATGPQFDHLFLTGMIMHHTGAVNMVKDLLATPGAGQDPLLFDFANDVDNTQLAEIDIMKHMLKENK